MYLSKKVRIKTSKVVENEEKLDSSYVVRLKCEIVWPC
jgi:hypothetical protein